MVASTDEVDFSANITVLDEKQKTVISLALTQRKLLIVISILISFCILLFAVFASVELGKIKEVFEIARSISDALDKE